MRHSILLELMFSVRITNIQAAQSSDSGNSNSNQKGESILQASQSLRGCLLFAKVKNNIKTCKKICKGRKLKFKELIRTTSLACSIEFGTDDEVGWFFSFVNSRVTETVFYLIVFDCLTDCCWKTNITTMVTTSLRPFLKSDASVNDAKLTATPMNGVLMLTTTRQWQTTGE